MFIRNKENFVCEHCGKEVSGNGYTNHCSYCLWSKHVDVDPGDRAAECGGLMEPVGAEEGGPKGWSIIHKCQRCGLEKKNKVSKEDNFEELVRVSSR